MLSDITTVVRKELAEILFPETGLSGSVRNVLVLLGIAGVWFPLQAGPAWFASWTSVGAACFPLILILHLAADAFAGERERHTLETLLATRLGDRTILAGKVLAIVLYGWGLVLAALPVGLIALNVGHRGPTLMFYRPVILVAIVVFGFLVSLLFCAIAVLASLTAPTVRCASQRMLLPFFVVFSVPTGLPWLLRRMHWEGALAGAAPAVLAALLAAGCLVAAAVALAIGARRFDRERLVLA